MTGSTTISRFMEMLGETFGLGGYLEVHVPTNQCTNTADTAKVIEKLKAALPDDVRFAGTMLYDGEGTHFVVRFETKTIAPGTVAVRDVDFVNAKAA